jgi:hypothetical protein
VLVYHKSRTLLRKGVMAPAAGSATGGKAEVMAIVQKALTQAPEPDGLSQPTYIPDLQVGLGFVSSGRMLDSLGFGSTAALFHPLTHLNVNIQTHTGAPGARGVHQLPPRALPGGRPPALRREPGPNHFGRQPQARLHAQRPDGGADRGPKGAKLPAGGVVEMGVGIGWVCIKKASNWKTDDSINGVLVSFGFGLDRYVALPSELSILDRPDPVVPRALIDSNGKSVVQRLVKIVSTHIRTPHVRINRSTVRQDGPFC